jgi:hypothetical protein
LRETKAGLAVSDVIRAAISTHIESRRRDPSFIDGEMNRLFATLKRSLAAENDEQFVCEAAEIVPASICGTTDTLIGFGLSTCDIRGRV